MSLLEAIADASEKIKQAKKELATQVQTEIGVVFKQIFDSDPKLTSFKWTQYTPYFNDGDTCEFSVYDYLIVEYDGKEYDDVDMWQAKKYVESDKLVTEYGRPVSMLRTLMPVLTLLSTVDNDIFKDVFGDHVEVTVTAEGINTEEYYHD